MLFYSHVQIVHLDKSLYLFCSLARFDKLFFLQSYYKKTKHTSTKHLFLSLENSTKIRTNDCVTKRQLQWHAVSVFLYTIYSEVSSSLQLLSSVLVWRIDKDPSVPIFDPHSSRSITGLRTTIGIDGLHCTVRVLPFLDESEKQT